MRNRDAGVGSDAVAVFNKAGFHPNLYHIYIYKTIGKPPSGSFPILYHAMELPKALCLGKFQRLHVDESTALFAAGEHNCAVNKRIKGVVLAHTHIQTGVMNCATLTLDDVACFGVLTAKNLYSESFAF